MTTTILIAEDEPLMRERLSSQLATWWPQAEVVMVAENGNDAWDGFLEHEPNVVFLDIRMPGKNGIEAAAQLAQNAMLIFVTAYDEYAIQAFERGAMDYLLKPIDLERLQQTCQRLQQRIAEKSSGSLLSTDHSVKKNQASQVEHLLTQLMEQQRQLHPKDYLRWIQASVGTSLRMISTKEILYFKSDEKYTLVQTEQAEFLIRKTLKELEDELDPKEFWRIHRSTLVRVNAIAEVTRDFRGRQMLGLKGCSEKLEVSRNHTHLFQQM